MVYKALVCKNNVLAQENRIPCHQTTDIFLTISFHSHNCPDGLTVNQAQHLASQRGTV